MKKVFVFFIALVFLTPNLFTQNYADVSANYRDTAYMDTLNGRKIQFPQQFLDSIKKFDVKSYRQSFPSSGVSALRSWIIFTCPFGLYPQIIDAELASITLDYANLRYKYIFVVIVSLSSSNHLQILI